MLEGKCSILLISFLILVYYYCLPYIYIFFSFFINLPPWKEAPVRRDIQGRWGFSYDLGAGEPKVYSRAKWFQEFVWDKESNYYLGRGYWSVVCSIEYTHA